MPFALSPSQQPCEIPAEADGVKATHFPHIMRLGSSRQRMYSQVFESKVCVRIHHPSFIDLEETLEGNEDEMNPSSTILSVKCQAMEKRVIWDSYVLD